MGDFLIDVLLRRIEQQSTDRLRLDRRIHNQRVALRMNWEIMEKRAQQRPIISENVRSRMLASWCAAQRRAYEAEARVKRLEEALKIWDEAFATGRSEPLYIARDAARAALEDK